MIDTADDIHAAEDRVGVLEQVLGEAKTYLEANRRWTDAPLLLTRIEEVLADRFCRPSCLGVKTAPCIHCGGLVGYSELDGFYHVDSDPIDGHEAEAGTVVDERGNTWEVELCDDCCGCPCGHRGADDTGA